MSELLRHAIASWWSVLPPLVLQGTLLLLLVALIDAVLPRRTWPEPRAGLWIVALVRLLVPPGLLDALATIRNAAPVLTIPPPPDLLLPPASEGLVLALVEIAFGVWAVGAVAILGLGAWQHRRTLQRVAESASDRPPRRVAESLERTARMVGLRRVPSVLCSPAVRLPLVVGMVRPRVILPDGFADELRDAELDHVLLHELMHLRRRDPWRAAAVALVTVLYWFHPLVWLANRRLAELREHRCDAAVARRLGDEAPGYRRTLLVLAGRLTGESVAGGLGLFGRRARILARSHLLERVPRGRARLRRGVTALSCALLFVVFVPLAPTADEAVAAVGVLLERPEGCLLMRMEVYRQLAKQPSAAQRLETPVSSDGARNSESEGKRP
ncbi:MAG: M56 family metallopeptidase [Acidobacteriota bacterium]|nr:MAG: M56 family metallopeptidase [Acidobacteriota bacterium]